MYQEQTAKIITRNATPPASLIIGSNQDTTDYAVRYIQNIVCLHGGCKTCTTCMGIANQVHYNLLWITPEQRYTLETIEPIMQAIQLCMEDDSHFFFVLSQADILSGTCANSLLKIVEEPPAGYHFIFLAQKEDAVLSTIRSRCIITHLNSTDNNFTSHSLFSFFTFIDNDNFVSFLKTVDQSKITEQECMNLLDALLIHWNNTYKKTNSIHANQQAHAIIELLKKYLTIPPMTGSTKLFLKNVYLALYNIIHKK